MYDRQILVDYFHGKRTADDPQVKHEFAMLRKEAERAYEEMYAGKRPREQTIKEIEEDYIYNARLTADSECRMGLSDWPEERKLTLIEAARSLARGIRSVMKKEDTKLPKRN